MDQSELLKIAKLLRYYIITSTSTAGSGHPTSSLSAVELMTALMFGGIFKFDIHNPQLANNDRLIFSKGHAAPLFYSLWAAAGGIDTAELLDLRKFTSTLEGHPMPNFKFTEAATGSLGQGLSNGVGMALNAKLENLNYRTYVLLGDGELMEGQNWEAAEFAGFHNLSNLVAFADINKFEQASETIHKWDLNSYKNKFEAFGWQTVLIENGNNLGEVLEKFQVINESRERPLIFIAKTLKGAGISFIEDKPNWHGKALNEEEMTKALEELGHIELNVKGNIAIPENNKHRNVEENNNYPSITSYDPKTLVATRKAYGNALVNLKKAGKDILVLDGGTQNSTFSETFQKAFPDSFIDGYIAEQNMVGVATGLSRRGRTPFVSTFAAFFTRAFDQIRMARYSDANIKFVGSHAGVSIGEDGPSQMALEDIAMFRSVLDSVVLYPSDAVSAEKLTFESYFHKGITYMRTTRKDTPILYDQNEKFEIGGSKVIKESVFDSLTVIAAGITVHEALKAYDELAKENIFIRIVDLYSIKPIDLMTLSKCIRETKGLVVVEDHYEEGGIGEAVRTAMGNTKTKIYSLAVRKLPRSGKPEELLDYEHISSKAIVAKIKEIFNSQNTI